MKKIIAIITAVAVSVLPLVTANPAQAAPKTVSAAAIGGYCC